jgi:hypothetical protein
MRCFTVHPAGAVTDGILLKDGMIEVGEPGRGRVFRRARIPVGSTLSENLVLDIPAKDPADTDSVVVLLLDQSGFRGTWNLRDPRTPAEWDHIAARKKSHEEGASRSWEEARITDTAPTGHGRYCQGINNCQECTKEHGPYPVTRPATWRVIEEGARAQGTAGYAGGGPEYLAVLREGMAVEVVRSGRLYGKTALFTIRNHSGGVTTFDPCEVRRLALSESKW